MDLTNGLTAMVFSRGWKLACRIFLLKSCEVRIEGPTVSVSLQLPTLMITHDIVNIDVLHSTSTCMILPPLALRARQLLGLECALVSLQHDVLVCVLLKDVEVVVVAPSQDLVVVRTPERLKLVKDAIVLVEVAQFRPDVLVDRNRLHRLVLHVDVPDLQREVVSREDVPSVPAELDV